MTAKRKLGNTEEFKKHIYYKYKIPWNKFDIIKEKNQFYIYLVTPEATLAKELIFKGSLKAAEKIHDLYKYIEKQLETILNKYNYL